MKPSKQRQYEDYGAAKYAAWALNGRPYSDVINPHPEGSVRFERFKRRYEKELER